MSPQIAFQWAENASGEAVKFARKYDSCLVDRPTRKLRSSYLTSIKSHVKMVSVCQIILSYDLTGIPGLLQGRDALARIILDGPEVVYRGKLAKFGQITISSRNAGFFVSWKC